MLSGFFKQLFNIIFEASPYILFGFFIAGILNIVFSTETLHWYLGKKRFKSIIYASLLGIPLPLCSCSVLPAAISLKKKGAGNGATLAFLISTPETGVESIAMTWGFIDGIMAIFRPIAAFFTSMIAGFSAELLNKDHQESSSPPEREISCNSSDTCECQCHSEPRDGRLKSLYQRSIGYAFGTLFDEISYWLLLGLVLSAVINVLIPQSFIEAYLGKGIFPMLFMLVVGIPLYVCASASTPIAAILMLKGLSPGAALVFLLVGPATNIGSITVLLKFLGKKMVAVYLISITIVSLVLGLILNYIYYIFKINPQLEISKTSEIFPEWLKITSMALFALLMVLSLIRTPMPEEWKWIFKKRFEKGGR